MVKHSEEFGLTVKHLKMKINIRNINYKLKTKKRRKRRITAGMNVLCEKIKTRETSLRFCHRFRLHQFDATSKNMHLLWGQNKKVFTYRILSQNL